MERFKVESFRTIDRMSLVDLSRYFEDIWYPGAEDIEIFDDTLSWILLVRHYGGVELARFVEISGSSHG